jgi:ADP-ribosylglycohydrolase
MTFITPLYQGRFMGRGSKVTVWTDDASMGLSMADSILLSDYHFDPQHLRYMFTMWLEHGLNNGGRPYSIGLGGNISISMGEFSRKQEDYA